MLKLMDLDGDLLTVEERVLWSYEPVASHMIVCCK